MVIIIRGDGIELKKAPVAVNTLILSVRAEANSNYRKLPEKKLCVLMTKADDESYWQVPKDIKGNNENLDQAALRKLSELVDRDDYYIEQLYSFSDSAEQGDASVNVSYLALTTGQTLKQQSRAEKLNYKWFEITYRDLTPNLPSYDVLSSIYTDSYEILMETTDEPKERARTSVVNDCVTKNQEPANTLRILDSENIGRIDSRILAYGIERLRNKIEYTDIVFHLMPERFTLKELQQVQELILDEKLYTAHFRRKIEPKLLKCLNQMREAKGHRPAQEYSYNPNWHIRTKLGGL